MKSMIVAAVVLASAACASAPASDRVVLVETETPRDSIWRTEFRCGSGLVETVQRVRFRDDMLENTLTVSFNGRRLAGAQEILDGLLLRSDDDQASYKFNVSRCPGKRDGEWLTLYANDGRSGPAFFMLVKDRLAFEEYARRLVTE